ncbi:hypothetical protein ACIPSJ_51535 [Streptomyces sp. NPDC090088]|uniref:hypothetical protein n=1 Tax=Streptomyces sp. NPDC090088 TaxID=3365944 RepID=UPI0037FBEB96
MTEVDVTVTGPEPQVQLPDVMEPVLDLHLQHLIKMLNDDETKKSHFGISLNIPGGVIYGQAISRDAYLDAWEAEIRQSSGAGAEFIATLPRKISEVGDKLVKGRDTKPLPRWIHLREATFLTGAPVQTMHYGLWRGRLSDVAGWSFSLPSA